MRALIAIFVVVAIAAIGYPRLMDHLDWREAVEEREAYLAAGYLRQFPGHVMAVEAEAALEVAVKGADLFDLLDLGMVELTASGDRFSLGSASRTGPISTSSASPREGATCPILPDRPRSGSRPTTRPICICASW